MMAAGGTSPPAGGGGSETPLSPLPPGDPGGIHALRLAYLRSCISRRKAKQQHNHQMQLLKDYIQSLRDEFAMLNATDTTTARDHDSLTSLPINYKTEEIQMMAPSGSGSAEKVAPPDGRGGWGPPISPQATTPAASFKTLMDDVHAALRKIDNLPGGYNDPPLASALEVYNCPSTKRTRARDDPVIAALLKALQDEHDRAVAKHENNHALLGETFNTSEPKAVVDSKKKPHSDTKTAPVPTTIDNDNKKTPTSDNVSTPAALLPLKPPCDSMCLLEQSAGGTSKTERKTKVVEDSTASTPPKKKKTPHSDTNTAPAPKKKKTPHSDAETAPVQTTIDNDNKKTPTSDNVSTPTAPLPLKPPCDSMCLLEQSAGGTSKTERKTKVVEDSTASTPPKKKKTPHSDTNTAPAPKKKKTPHSDAETAPVQTTIDNDNKKTPTSDNVSTPTAPLPLKPPCDSMCLLEQSAGGTSKTERKTKVVEDSTASTPPKKKKTPHSDTKTAPVPTTIDKDHKKTPPSDNVSTPAAPLPLKLPCNSMCPLEQSAGGPSQTEWKTEVVDDSAVSTPREKTRTTHSGNWETTAGMRFFCQWVHDCPPRKDALCDHLVRHLHGNHDDCAVDDFYDADF